MKARQRRRKKQRINEANLAPKIRAGFTQDASIEEAFQHTEHLRNRESGLARARVLAGADERIEHGDGFAQFVAENDSRAVWTDGVTDRVQLDIHKTYTGKGLRLLKEGRICLRCDEPLDPSFPLACPLCGYAVKDRQIMDIAMEFEGEKHIGPSRPVTEYLEEQDARMEKRRFIKRILEGGTGRVPKEWLRDPSLMEGLTPDERAMIGARA